MSRNLRKFKTYLNTKGYKPISLTERMNDAGFQCFVAKYVNSMGRDVTDEVLSEKKGFIDEELKELKKLRSSIKRIFENRTRLSQEINQLFDNHSEYTFAVWRVYRILCLLFGVDPVVDDGSKIFNNSICFWNYCMRTDNGMRILTALDKLIKTCPTILSVAVRIFMFARIEYLRVIISNKDELMNKSDGGNDRDYAFAYLVNEYGLQRSRIGNKREFAEKAFNYITEIVNELERSGNQSDVLDNLKSIVKKTMMTDWLKESELGTTPDIKNNIGVRFFHPLFTAAISVFVRGLSYYYTYSNPLETQIDEAYSEYEKYCELTKTSPALLSTFLNDNGLLENIKDLYSRKRFVEICNSETNTDPYSTEYESCIERLEKIAAEYKKKCENL